MRNTVFTLLFFGLFSGCDDNLNIEPVDSLIPETVLQNPENLHSLLLGAYLYASNRLGGRIQTENELFANEGKLLWNGADFNIAQFDRRNLTSTNLEIMFNWVTPYRSINLCNVVLDNLDILRNTSKRNLLEGEARFLRGLQYFELVKIYALPYDEGRSNTQLGVPIVLDGVITISQIKFPTRESVEVVYKQVIEDLEQAYSLLPEDNGIFADRYAAMGLLARVFLQMGNFEEALNASHTVISNSGHTLAPDINGAFNNGVDGIEDLFMWQVTVQDGKNSFNELWSTNVFGGGSSTADLSIEPTFLELFTGTDERGTFFYQGNGTLVTSKWQSEFANVPYLRLAEMYLIRAECNFRLGSNLGSDPETDINKLRDRANAESTFGITLDDILAERKRELAFEGHTLHDAKRLKRDIDGIPYNDDQLIFPIPQRELDANPNLEPNPAYSN